MSRSQPTDEPTDAPAEALEPEESAELEPGDNGVSAGEAEDAPDDTYPVGGRDAAAMDDDAEQGDTGQSDAGETGAGGESSAEGPGLEKTRPASVGEGHLKTVLESLVFVSDKPVTAQHLAKVARTKPAEVRRLLGELAEEYKGRGIELNEVAGGWQFRTAVVNAPFVREMVSQKPVRLTRAQLETLAITAYRQPLTRPELEDIRGVDSGSALKVLADRGLIKIIGRKDEPGRPLLYGTTPAFLEFFGLRSLKDLPTLQEFSELSEESRTLFERRMGEPMDISNIEVPKDEQAADGDDEQEPDSDAAAADSAQGEGEARSEDEDRAGGEQAAADGAPSAQAEPSDGGGDGEDEDDDLDDEEDEDDDDDLDDEEDDEDDDDLDDEEGDRPGDDASRGREEE